MDDDEDDEKKLLPRTEEEEDIYGTLRISVLEVTKLPKELQIIIAGYVGLDCYAGFRAFATKIRKMMCTCDNISIEVTARESRGEHSYTDYTLYVPLASVLKPQDAPLSIQQLSDLFLRSKKSFHMVQLEQVLSDETRTHIEMTVFPFVEQRASLRFPPGLLARACIRDSQKKRTLDTHRSLNLLGLPLLILLSLAIFGIIGYFLYFIVPWIVIVFPVSLILLWSVVVMCCESRQKARADTTITQTFVWGNEDFRESLADVVAQAQLTERDTDPPDAQSYL